MSLISLPMELLDENVLQHGIEPLYKQIFNKYQLQCYARCNANAKTG